MNRKQWIDRIDKKLSTIGYSFNPDAPFTNKELRDIYYSDDFKQLTNPKSLDNPDETPARVDADKVLEGTNKGV